MLPNELDKNILQTKIEQFIYREEEQDLKDGSG